MSSSSAVLSSPSLCSATGSSPLSAAASLASLPHAQPLRKNEHLAVALPRHLWKPDSDSNKCDTVACKRRFSLFDRRHHCRKCGGLFCHACSAQETWLLEPSTLSLPLPPRGTSVWAHATAETPVNRLRVCDTCYSIIHGEPIAAATGRLPSALLRSAPRAVVPVSPSESLASSLSIGTPPDGTPVSSPTPAAPGSRGSRRAGTRTDTLPRAISNASVAEVAAPPKRARTGSLPVPPGAAKSRAGSMCASPRLSPRTLHARLPHDRPRTLADVAPELAALSFGELERYPLRVPSAVCKATVESRWAPRPHFVPHVLRGTPGEANWLAPIPDPVAVAAAHRRANPIRRFGEFQIRTPVPPEPVRPSRVPESTF